ncbi:unnamed protein product, partial [Ectocarpus sp. 12 AP-2014]
LFCLTERGCQEKGIAVPFPRRGYRYPYSRRHIVRLVSFSCDCGGIKTQRPNVRRFRLARLPLEKRHNPLYTYLRTNSVRIFLLFKRFFSPLHLSEDHSCAWTHVGLRLVFLLFFRVT